MAEVTEVNGEETRITVNDDELDQALLDSEFDGPLMWDN